MFARAPPGRYDPGRDMWKRPPALIGLIAVLALLAAGTWAFRPAAAPASDTDEILPIPPIPPRIAEGADYERCLGMLGDDPAGASAFADAWVATGGGDGAAHCLALATIQLGDPEKGAEELDRLGGSTKAADAAKASIYGQAGQAWLMAGNADRAMVSFTLALSMAPEDPDLLIDRSLADATTEQYAQAVGDLSRALALDPRRADALIYRASAYRHLNRLDQAREDIERAFLLDEANPDALLERGILRQLQGDRAGARADWEQAVQLSPDSATGDLAQQNLALLDAGPDRR